MKVTRHYLNTGKGIAKMHITFLITSDMIEYACYELVEADKKVITRGTVEKKIRDILTSDGGEHWCYRQLEEEAELKAKEIAENLFPDFYIDYRNI